MKKFKILGALAALPFILVWSAFILTAFNFDPHNVFNDGAFWGLSVMYWLLYICLIGPIVEALNETEKPAR